MNMKKAINFCAFPMSRFQVEKHIYLFLFSFTPLLYICVELSAVYGTKHGGRRNVNNLYLRKCDFKWSLEVSKKVCHLIENLKSKYNLDICDCAFELFRQIEFEKYHMFYILSQYITMIPLMC